MINVQNISSKLASLPDQALKQYAEMHKEDPYVFSLAISESNRRKQLRSQSQQPPPQPKVVDQALQDMDVRKALPEDLGIARIPVDMNMAGGGIVAFGGGGMAHYARGGNAGEGFSSDEDSDAFKFALNNTLGLEGALNKDDKVGGLTKYGISQKSYPKLDIAKLTPAEAKAIYKRDYWDKIGGDEIAAKDPKLAALMFDTAVQHGVSGAKDMFSQSGDDPVKLLQIRSEKLQSLVQDNPEKYGSQAKGWSNRIAKLAYTLAPGSTAQAATPTEVPSSGGDRVSDQTLSNLITGKPKPTPVTGPSATAQGIRQALMTKEGAKRAGIGALEDSAIGVAGMPSDLGRGMSSSSVPIVRSLGTAADYLKRKFAPNAEADVGTTSYLKRKATEAGIRPEDSPDPNLRAIQSGGEFAGYFVNPINALRSGAGKIGNVIREGRAELAASGLQDIANKKAAVAAAAKAQADATAKTSAPLRLTNETVPVAPGAAATGPSLGAKAELDKMEAANRARIAAGFEKDAATAKAMAEKKAAEAVNAPPKAIPGKPAGVSQQAWNEANAAKAPPKGSTSPTKTASVIASPGQVLARNTGKENFPDVSMGDGSEGDTARETQSLSNRYPAPDEKPIDYDQGVGRRDAGYGSTDKQIVSAAKEALPKTEDTDGWSKNDWLQFGLSLMAGQSPYALSNIGAAGLAVISAKAEKAKEQNKLDLYKSVNADKPGQSIQIAERLMAADPKLTFEQALAKTTSLIGGSTRDEMADIKADLARTARIKAYQDGMKAIEGSMTAILGKSATATPAQKQAYEKAIAELGPNPALEGGQQATLTAPSAASALGWGKATKQ